MKKFEEMTMDELKALYNEKIEKEKEPSKAVEEKPKRWRAEKGEYYCYVDDYGDIQQEIDTCSYCDDFRYKIGNYFKTEEELEEYKKKVFLQKVYENWCKFDCDWNDNNQNKYYAYYSFFRKEIWISDTCFCKFQGITYAKSRKRIKEFIDKIGEDDFKKYILEVEE